MTLTLPSFSLVEREGFKQMNENCGNKVTMRFLFFAVLCANYFDQEFI